MLAALERNRQGPQTSAPGPGNASDAMNKLLQAVQLIQQAAMGLPPGSRLHQHALRAAQNLSRDLPQGAPTLGVQATGMRDMMRAITQSGFLPNIMRMFQGGGGGQQQGGGAQPPMPSMPLPGA